MLASFVNQSPHLPRMSIEGFLYDDIIGPKLIRSYPVRKNLFKLNCAETNPKSEAGNEYFLMLFLV